MIAHCVPLCICMHSNVSTTKTSMFGIKYIHSKGSCFLSIPGGAIAYTLELGCDPKRILHMNQTNLFFAVKTRHLIAKNKFVWFMRRMRFGSHPNSLRSSDAEKVQAKEDTYSKHCPCTKVHKNRDGILNEMFEEFRCCWQGPPSG